MQLVIADTGPINYLILIGHIDILPPLFEKVIPPAVIRDELKHQKAPPAVQHWIADPPSWVEAHQAAHVHDPSMETLDAGEEDAIALAIELHADLILMDDRDGVPIARSKEFRVAGTLGILSMAADHRLINLAEAFERIKRTSFHYQQETMISCSPKAPAASREARFAAGLRRRIPDIYRVRRHGEQGLAHFCPFEGPLFCSSARLRPGICRSIRCRCKLIFQLYFSQDGAIALVGAQAFEDWIRLQSE